MRPLIVLAISCSLLCSCNREQPKADEIAERVEMTIPPPPDNLRPAPNPAPAVVTEQGPGLVDTILQRANSTASISFATNGDTIDCTFKSPNLEDRVRVRNVVSELFGVYQGTLDPPTITFKFQPLLYKTAAVPITRPPIGPDNVHARLQQRLAMERSIDLQEIRDYEHDIELSEQTIPGRVGGLAFTKAQIMNAKGSHLSDLIARYQAKYGSYP